MIIGQNVTILGDNHARSQSMLLWSLEVPLVAARAESVSEELPEEWIHRGGIHAGDIFSFRGDEDLDHAGSDLFNNRGKARAPAFPRERLVVDAETDWHNGY